MDRKNPKKSQPPPIDPVTQYAQSVVAGEIITGRLVRLACERHLRDLEQGSARGLHFDPEAAAHAIEFFPSFLRHNEGRHANQPFELSPHQKFIVGSLYGWLKADGYRRFRHCYWEEGKGGGKTPTASGCGIYGLTMDGEEGAEIYCAAVTRDQAGIAFRDCKNMAEKSLLADRLNITEHNIAYEATNSFLRPVSSEARSLDGKRVFMSLIDEEHEHPTPLVIDKMTAGNKGRTQPLNIRTTNSGYDRTSVCWYEHEYSRQILEGLAEDDDWFAYVCQLDPCVKCVAEGKAAPQDDCPDCDHYWDEGLWLKTNPNLDVSITREYLRSEVKKARLIPSKALTVKRLNFCVWTEQAAHWMPMDEWDACGTTPINLESLRGRVCYGGLDLGDTSDTTSLGLIFPPLNQADPFILLSFVWIPRDMQRRTGQERARFESWISQELIIATDGNRISHRWVAQFINKLRTERGFDMRIMAMDPYHADDFQPFAEEEAGFTTDEKEAEIYRKPLLLKFPQTMACMTGPTKLFVDHVLQRKIAHGGNSVLRWAVGNVVIEEDGAGNQRPLKGKSTDKIDPAVGAIMSLGVALRNAIDTSQSKYETQDLLVL
jgi:phage terminase large subunit-like protein